MSSQPLSLAIRLAAKQEEKDTESERPVPPEAHAVENAAMSPGKGGVEDGRGNLRFWLRDIKIAESLYTVSIRPGFFSYRDLLSSRSCFFVLLTPATRSIGAPSTSWSSPTK